MSSIGSEADLEKMQNTLKYQQQSDSNTSLSSKKRHGKYFSDWARDMVEDSKGYKHNFIDTNCQIDLIYQRLGLKAQAIHFSQFRLDNLDTWPVNYEGCVTVFCKPYMFLDSSCKYILYIG